MKKHSIFLGFIILILGSILMGCGDDKKNSNEGGDKQSNNGDSVEITFWDQNAGPERTPIWEELIEKFESENPDIKVKYVGLPNSEAKSKFDTAIATESTPDVASIVTRWLSGFAARDALLPLDDYLNNSDLNGKLNNQVIDFVKNMVHNNQLYAIPYAQNMDVFWARSDMFSEAKVEAFNTWDEFFNATKTLTNDDHYGLTIRGGDNGSFPLQSLIFAYTGQTEFFDENGDANINSSEAIEFVTDYLGLYKEYTPKSDITAGFQQLIQNFGSGSVAMMYHNLSSYPQHKSTFEPNQFEAVAVPTVSGEDYRVVEGENTESYTIFKTTKHPEASWKFVEFLNSKESQDFLNQAIGTVPTNTDTAESDWVKETDYIKMAVEVYNDPNTKLFAPPSYLPDYDNIMTNVVTPGIQEVLNGTITAEELLNNWAEATEKSYEKYQETFNK